MKKLLLSIILLSAIPLAAQASCETVKAEVSQKIIKNGVPESGFTLDIVPNAQVDASGGLVVGHCENDTQKIIYQRTSGADGANRSENRWMPYSFSFSA